MPGMCVALVAAMTVKSIDVMRSRIVLDVLKQVLVIESPEMNQYYSWDTVTSLRLLHMRVKLTSSSFSLASLVQYNFTGFI